MIEKRARWQRGKERRKKEGKKKRCEEVEIKKLVFKL